MTASVSIAARDSFFGTTASLVSSHDRSPAVRNVHLLPMRTRLTPRVRVFGLQRAQARLEVDVLGQPRAERLLVERHRGGKQQRLQQPQMLRARLGCASRLRFLLGPRLELFVGDDASFRQSRHASESPYVFYSVARGIAALELTAASAASSRLRR